MIVLDASVAILGLLSDGDARRALATEPLAAPHLIDSEVAHALRRRVLARDQRADDAGRALDRWTRLALRRHPAVGLLARVWELRANVSAYDATYVALAEALEVELVTADGRLANAAGPRCPIRVLRG